LKQSKRNYRAPRNYEQCGTKRDLSLESIKEAAIYHRSTPDFQTKNALNVNFSEIPQAKGRDFHSKYGIL
jgi:hypothetical protein